MVAPSPCLQRRHDRGGHREEISTLAAVRRGLTRLEQTSGTARLAWSSQPQTVPMTAMEHTALGQALRAVVPCIETPTLQKVVDALFNPSLAAEQTDPPAGLWY